MGPLGKYRTGFEIKYYEWYDAICTIFKQKSLLKKRRKREDWWMNDRQQFKENETNKRKKWDEKWVKEEWKLE